MHNSFICITEIVGNLPLGESLSSKGNTTTEAQSGLNYWKKTTWVGRDTRTICLSTFYEFYWPWSNFSMIHKFIITLMYRLLVYMTENFGAQLTDNKYWAGTLMGASLRMEITEGRWRKWRQKVTEGRWRKWRQKGTRNR